MLGFVKTILSSSSLSRRSGRPFRLPLLRSESGKGRWTSWLRALRICLACPMPPLPSHVASTSYLPNTTSARSLLVSRVSLSVALMTVLVASSACSSVKPLEVHSVPLQLDKPEARPPVPNPAPVRTLPVEWVVLTPDRLPQGKDWVFIALTPKQYENLSKNMADLERWVTEAAWRLRYYRGEGERHGQ